MKKFICMALCVLMVLSLVSCGGKKKEWEKFLDEYDAWTDSYIETMEDYKENPMDATVLGKLTKLAEEAADWSERADKISKELESASADEKKEFLAELQKITAKVAKVTF